MHLLDFPPEILYLIISQSVPTSYEGLVLTCKALLEIGRPLLSLHNALRGYRNCAYVSKRNQRASRQHKVRIMASPYDLLLEICRNPQIQNAIETVSFERATDGSVPARVHAWKATDYATLDTLLEQNERLWSRAGFEKEELMEQMFWVDPHGIMINCALAETVLLALLPQLKVVVLDSDWASDFHEDGLHHRAFAALVRQANETRAGGLASLRELLTSRHQSDQTIVSLNSFQPFLALQTLEIAKLTRCHWGETESIAHRDMVVSYKRFSGLQKLELETSAMNKDELTKLVSCMPRLEILVLNLEEDDRTAKGIRWDVGKLVPELGQAVGKTLQSLSIRTPDLPERLWSPVKSFRSFEKLRELEVDLNIFHHHRPDNANSDVTAAVDTSIVDVSAHVIPRLIDILPASLEKLRLRVDLGTPYRFGSVECAPILRTMFEDFETGLQNVMYGLRTVELWQVEAQKTFKGSEAETEELKFAVREITWGESNVRLVTEPGFKIGVMEHDWLVADQMRSRSNVMEYYNDRLDFPLPGSRK